MVGKVITRENFESYIHRYEEDEIFYRDLYFHEKESPDTFEAYLSQLDRNLIRSHNLYVPALQEEKFHPYVMEEDISTILNSWPGNLVFYKHYRYTPPYKHRHEFFEFLCIWDGIADVWIQGIHHCLHTGDILVVSPRTDHSVSIMDESVAFNLIVRGSTFRSTFLPIVANNSALSQFFSHVLFNKTEGNYLIFHTGDDERIRSTLREMYVEFLGTEKYRTAYLDAQLVLFWAQLLRWHEEDIESILTKAASSISMTRIMNYLNQNADHITMQEAAEHFGFSPSRFSTLLKEGTGQTFTQIIKDIRMTRASQSLRETDLSVNAVSDLVGYESPEHFMRTFKKVYGVTPSQYRAQYRLEEEDGEK